MGGERDDSIRVDTSTEIVGGVIPVRFALKVSFQHGATFIMAVSFWLFF